MDPNTNLIETRELAARLLRTVDRDELPDAADTARLAELVIALDKWCQRGGFLPDSWEDARRKHGRITNQFPDPNDT